MSGSIGPHTFAYLLGQVAQLRHDVETLEKNGEDGFIRRLKGWKSPDFELETLGGYGTKGDAENALATFEEMARGAAVSLTKDGHDYTSVGITVGGTTVLYGTTVIGASKLELRRAVCSSFGPAAPWLLRVNWNLRLVPL